MLAKTLYSEEETTDCCCTFFCKCLNTKIDFINQSLNTLNRDETVEKEYFLLETSLDDQKGVNSTLFCRSFLLSINIKFKWLIECTIISNRYRIYKCHGCSYDLFVSTNNILGKSLINFELQNFNPDIIKENINYSHSFDILMPYNDLSQIQHNKHNKHNKDIDNIDYDININNPLTIYCESLREKEENAMEKRIEEFKQNEERKFNLFCSNLDKEFNILYKKINTNKQCINPFDFKINSLMKIEKDYNSLMEENLKLDHEDVYNYLLLNNITTTTDIQSLNNDIHNIYIKLPLNESGEIIYINDDDNNNYINETDESIHEHESPSNTIVEHYNYNSQIKNIDLYDEDDENVGFDAISEEEEEEEEEDIMFELDDDNNNDDDENDKFHIEENSLTQTPQSSVFKRDSESGLKMIPTLNINNINSTETVKTHEIHETQQTIESLTHISHISHIDEDSETDDRIFGNDITIDNSNSNKSTNNITRIRGNARSSKNDSMQRLLISSNFKIKSSKSLQIKSTFHTKSLLSKTLNKNSALVNLNKKNHNQINSNTNTNINANITSNLNANESEIINPKTFNPPKQWLDVLKQKKPQQQIKKYKNNGKSLTINNHTFTGIWAKTNTQNNNINHNINNIDDEKINIHSLFDNKQNQQTNNVYAYSMTPKYSIKQNNQ